MYRVQLAPTVAKALSSFHPDIRKQLKAGMKELADNPYAGKMMQEKLAGFRTYRMKRYRVVYKVDEDEKLVRVYMIGHRREIYDLFSKLVSYP